MTDRELLQRYVANGEQQAFGELARRHLNMMHAAARRQAGQAAEDVVQAALLLLAQKAATISPRASVAGWLYSAVRYCCANVKKMEHRRLHHEHKAAAMANQRPDPGPEHLLPLLDEAMATLGSREREAVLLRYLEAKSVDETARELDVSSAAAAKRAARGLEKVRLYFAKQGYVVPTAAIGGILTAEAAKAATTALAQTIFTTQPLAAAPAVISIMKGAQILMAASKIKSLVIVVILCLLFSGLTTIVVVHMRGGPTNDASKRSTALANLATITTPSATPSASTQLTGAGGNLSATLPGGTVVELVAISRFPVDADGWWQPDGSPMATPLPQGLMTADMIGSRDFPGRRAYNFFVRYRMPGRRAQPVEARADDDRPRTVRRTIGKDPFFQQLVIPMPDNVKAGAICFSVGMSVVETLLDTKTPLQSGETIVPDTNGEKITFQSSTKAPLGYAIAIECPTDLISHYFVRPVATIDGKDVANMTSAQSQADTSAPGMTRLEYALAVDPAHIDRFRLEVYRPANFIRFANLSLDAKNHTAPTAEAQKGERQADSVKEN